MCGYFIKIYDHIRDPRPPKKNKGGVADKGNSLFRGGYVQTGAHRPKIGGGRAPDMVIYLYKVFAHDPYILYIYIYDHIRGPRPSKKKSSDNVVFKSTTFIYIPSRIHKIV